MNKEEFLNMVNKPLKEWTVFENDWMYDCLNDNLIADYQILSETKDYAVLKTPWGDTYKIVRTLESDDNDLIIRSVVEADNYEIEETLNMDKEQFLDLVNQDPDEWSDERLDWVIDLMFDECEDDYQIVYENTLSVDYDHDASEEEKVIKTPWGTFYKFRYKYYGGAYEHHFRSIKEVKPVEKTIIVYE